MEKIDKKWFDFCAAPHNSRTIVSGLLGLALAFGPNLPSAMPDKHMTTAPRQAQHAIPALRLSFADAAPAPALELLFQPRLAVSFDGQPPHRLSGPQPAPNATGIIFVNAKTGALRPHLDPHGFKASAALHAHAKRGRLLAALQEKPSFLRFMTSGIATNADAKATGDTPPGLDDAVTVLDAPAKSPYAVDKLQAVPPKSALTDSENRRAATLGIARDSMQFDDRPGRLSSAAEAGVWNGQPAAALGLGYTLPSGRARVNATGVSSGQKTFGVTAVASIAFN